MGSRFSTVLVANRGEIACRIIRSAHSLGLHTVAVYSDADRSAPHVHAADLAVNIGPPPAKDSYLRIEALIEAARKTGAEAIHPGYGFLSENAAFGHAVAEAGLIFIGPSVEALEIMGSKRQAKERMMAAGVPCVPGFQAQDADEATLIAGARSVGFPLMIKASLGGGGKGLRRVDSEAELRSKLALARAEAEAAFGSGELILERAILNPRHVEVQVFGDEHGNVIHLGERDCSMQRRHQKVVEEAPSPAVDETLRRHMGEAAVQAAKSIGYVGAGTVEFLLGPDQHFYFMEMNTRLQVEHPVTEAVSGLDLVAWQLEIAQGEPLPLRQEEVRLSGHAIEVRLYAEDPAAGFLPSTGRLEHLRWPMQDGLRVDHGLQEGLEVTAHYDPLLAKLITHGRTREEARRRMVRALELLELGGVSHNRDFLLAALRHPVFAAGETTTDFLESSPLVSTPRAAPRPLDWAIAAILFANPERSHWSSTGQPRLEIELRHEEELRRIGLRPGPEGWTVELGPEALQLHVELAPGKVAVEHRGVRERTSYRQTGDGVELFGPRPQLRFGRPSPADRTAGASAERELRAPMSGRIVQVHTQPGARVQRGEVLLVMEAMKMQLEITAKAELVVETVRVQAGEQVDSKQVLIGFAESEGSSR